jgi:flagellar basal body-associated protein FliL
MGVSPPTRPKWDEDEEDESTTMPLTGKILLVMLFLLLALLVAYGFYDLWLFNSLKQ